jgi:uncharacterized protein (TIGR02646 family)
MMRIERLPTPECLLVKGAVWTEEYETSGKFSWRTFQKKAANHWLLPPLREMTGNHCSFCDSYPLNTSGETIEHFRPKEPFRQLAYEWTNLFYCCYHCQKKKRANFDEALLKPDHESYEFTSYFIYDSITGELRPNPASSVDHQQRAKVTTEMYGLNHFGRPESRKEFFNKYSGAQALDLELYPYRFIY